MKYPINFNIELKRNSYPGLYIVLEGVDGSGKTTQVERLTDYYKARGKKVVSTREPRKVGLMGDLIHKILLGEEKIPSVSLQYLFSADRAAHHEELILPSLKKGEVVISDRCFWSAIVYGILDRTGGAYDKREADLLLITQSILSMYHQFTIPDYTFYLQVDLKTALGRLGAKIAKKEIYETPVKIEKLITGYNYLLSRFPEEIIKIDGTRPIDEITQEIVSKSIKK